MIQAFIAIYAEQNHLTDDEVLEQIEEILSKAIFIEELLDPSHYIEIFESFQRQDSNESIAQDFLSGNTVGYTEVSYDPETGCETPIDHGEWS